MEAQRMQEYAKENLMLPLRSSPIASDSLASLGSIGHAERSCKPCLFVRTPVGCQNGALCQFCHFTHKGRNTPRPCKGKRDRYRKLIERRVNEAAAANGESPASVGGLQLSFMDGSDSGSSPHASSSSGSSPTMSEKVALDSQEWVMALLTSKLKYLEQSQRHGLARLLPPPPGLPTPPGLAAPERSMLPGAVPGLDYLEPARIPVTWTESSRFTTFSL